MAILDISHHERVEGHPHRWHVHLRDRDEPLLVELPPQEREKLELTDDEIHQLLPTALERHAADVGHTNFDAPVRVLQQHFIA
jgi:hypothetical protein